MNKKASEKKYNFERSVQTTISRYGMIECGDKVAVALSGGADSVSLLLCLHALSKKLSFSLCACHLNHMIRKTTAQRDEDFSKELCDKLCVPFYSEKVDVPFLCENEKGSVETVARNARYSFFERAMAHLGANKLATAHTASDNAETVIFNLTRGSGADGICGIPPVRDCFVRPLIEQKRCDVEEYLSEIGQDFVTDETNDDEEYSRNFIRKSIVPQLKRLNPELENAILRLSQSMREDKELIAGLCQNISDEKSDAKSLCTLPPSLLKRHIKDLFSKACNDNAFLSGKNTDDVICAIKSTANDGKERKICLDSGIFAVIRHDGICFSDVIKEDGNIEFFDIPVRFGENIINEKYAVFVTRGQDDTLPEVLKNQDIVYKLYKNVRVISDIIDNSVFIRQRQEKDVFRLGGISRKLKKVFADAKIPRDERGLVPIVYTKNGKAQDKIICLPIFSSASDSTKAQDGQNFVTVAFYRS